MRIAAALVCGSLALALGGALVGVATGGQDAPPADASAVSSLPTAEALALEVATLRAALAAAEEGCRRELEELRTRLDAVNARRAERELAWYEYNRTLVQLNLSRMVPPFPVDPAYEPPAPAGEGSGESEGSDASAAAGVEEGLAEREREIASALSTYLRAEEIRGLDLLQVGTLDRGAIGPVVFRLLDDRGRLSGGLSAERLRLEASRAGHTVTLVLENGFESRGGERTPFRSGTRRIVLPYVDPEPWIATFPELFPPSELAPPIDDGRWSHVRVKDELNRLLSEDAEHGFYRVRRFDAIAGDTFSTVHLEAYGADGGLERRLFADRMTIEADEEGVRLTLEGGVVVRANERAPFVDGVYRIYLPAADAQAWRAARLPGLAAPQETEAATEPAAEPATVPAEPR